MDFSLFNPIDEQIVIDVLPDRLITLERQVSVNLMQLLVDVILGSQAKSPTDYVPSIREILEMMDTSMCSTYLL